MKIALFGDSYISRLQRHCGGDLQIDEEVRFFGQGGMRADQLHSRFKYNLQQLLQYQPDIVFINLAGNDITEDSAPADVFANIQKLLQTLTIAGVKTILYQEIGPRGKFRGNLTRIHFDRQRRAINKKLKKHKTVQLISVQKLSYPGHFCTDMVHYDEAGMVRYFNVVRSVLLAAIHS